MDEELIPLDELLALADVTEADIDSAIADWKANPPNDRWRNVMEAERLGEEE